MSVFAATKISVSRGATAENINNITNTATTSNSQEQSACAVAVTCPEGSTTVTPPTPPAQCPHPPYIDFVAGVGCQNGEPTQTCNPSTVGGITATPTDGTCTATLPAGTDTDQLRLFEIDCLRVGTFDPGIPGMTDSTCTFPATQTCPTPTGSTQRRLLSKDSSVFVDYYAQF